MGLYSHVVFVYIIGQSRCFMWPRAFVYILDSNFRVVFVQNFDTKRGNALSWEILSLNQCALFIAIETKGKVFWK